MARLASFLGSFLPFGFSQGPRVTVAALSEVWMIDMKAIDCGLARLTLPLHFVVHADVADGRQSIRAFVWSSKYPSLESVLIIVTTHARAIVHIFRVKVRPIVLAVATSATNISRLVFNRYAWIEALSRAAG